MSVGKDKRLALLGWVAIAFYGVHAAYLAATGLAEHALWSCHLGCLLSGFGLALSVPLLEGVGLCWLAVGFPAWIASLLLGGEFVPTSPLTHLGGFAIAAYGATRARIPRRTWLAATAGLALLREVSRLVTPAESNVNLVDRGWFGFEERYVSYPLYALLTLAGAGLAFLAVEAIGRRIGRSAYNG